MQAVSFFKLCSNGNMQGVKNYVEKDRKNPYDKDKNGYTGLVHAIWGKHIDIVKYLLEVAPNIEYIQTVNLTYPQSIAILTQDIRMITLFFEVMPATDFAGKLKQLENPPEFSHLRPHLAPYKKQLRKIYDTPEFRANSEMYRATRIALAAIPAKPKPEPKPEPKTEPKQKPRLSMTDSEFSSLHCVIRIKLPS
jgi:ankyrin repeat protein